VGPAGLFLNLQSFLGTFISFLNILLSSVNPHSSILANVNFHAYRKQQIKLFACYILILVIYINIGLLEEIRLNSVKRLLTPSSVIDNFLFFFPPPPLLF
jgi:hypothetical protein